MNAISKGIIAASISLTAVCNSAAADDAVFLVYSGSELVHAGIIDRNQSPKSFFGSDADHFYDKCISGKNNEVIVGEGMGYIIRLHPEGKPLKCEKLPKPTVEQYNFD